MKLQPAIEPHLPMLKFTLFPLLLLPLFSQAETFLSLQVEDLTFEKGKGVPDSFDAGGYYSSSLRKWVTPTAPYLRTFDAEDAFLHVVRERNNPNRLPTTALRICLRNPKDAVKGSLFIKDGDKGVKEYPFTLNSKKTMKLAADRKGEVTYLKNRMEHYQRLQNLGVPGTAWFRHQTNQTSERLKVLQPAEKNQQANNRPNRFNRPTRKVGLERTIDLFSGGRAISENLQLDRELRLSSDEQNRTISLSEIKGITIDEMPWKELIGDAKPKLDPLANVLPHDQHALFFPTFKSMVEVMDEATAQGTLYSASVKAGPRAPVRVRNTVNNFACPTRS